jgi:hypothetical protein
MMSLDSTVETVEFPSSVMTLTQKRVLTVLSRIKDQIVSDHDDALAYSEALNDILDELGQADFFGTEGQNDPRGDQRNGLWTMGRVEGVDPR